MDGWNIFDFLVVVASFLPFGSGQIAILRLMRLLRLLKLVHTVRSALRTSSFRLASRARARTHSWIDL